VRIVSPACLSQAAARRLLGDRLNGAHAVVDPAISDHPSFMHPPDRDIKIWRYMDLEAIQTTIREYSITDSERQKRLAAQSIE
jgi:hypothetical protein